MVTQVKKWGNSLAIRIPKKMIESLDWSEGAIVDFEKIGDKVVISAKRKKYTLEDMVKGITLRNRHKLIFPDDKPRGKEIW